jgi:hypothetical protein
MLTPARADGIQNVATFQLDWPAALVFEIGQQRGAKWAAIIVDHPVSSTGSWSAATSNSVVIMFDKQQWSSFEKAWNDARECRGSPRIGAIACPAHTYTDPKGAVVTVAMSKDTQVVNFSVFDRDGNHGILYLSADQRSLGDMKEAIRKITNYLNS